MFGHSPMLCYNLCTKGKTQHNALISKTAFKEKDQMWLGKSLQGIFNPSSDIWLAVDYLTHYICFKLDNKLL